MQLLDAIFLVGQMPEHSVIYTREPFHLSNEAKIVQFGKDDTVARNDKKERYVYFLEAEIVTELLEMIASKRSSRETKAEFVCHYATWDAYPGWAFYLEDA
jgi:hypothetical protein